MARKKASMKEARQDRRVDRRRQEQETQEQYGLDPRPEFDTSPVSAKNENQKRYMNAVNHYQLTFGSGPAGTGKTYIATALAAAALQERSITKIVITRPAVEAGENLGFLPGELEDKFGPYLVPFRDVLNQRLGKGFVDLLIKNGQIEAIPLAYMRGRTFRNAFVILDEAQNTTPVQMKMFLTRIGENCKVVVNGDLAQQDIRGLSGLGDAIDRCSWIPAVKHVAFTKNDIVRSGLVADIVSSYDSQTPLTRHD